MKHTKQLLITFSTLSILAACAAGCSDDTDESGGSGGSTADDVCSDEAYVPALGGAGGAPAPSCEAPEAPLDTIELIGTYEDNFGGTFEITASTWSDSFGTVYNLSLVNNEENYVLARNAETNFGGCTWLRISWVENEDGSIYTCTSPFDASSECAAEEADAPDSSDPETGGCSDFPWTKGTPN
ncbi:MAG: hypothetical protein MK135_01585 [Polyangiaceae bacterium]|nr:hypothetical protein [Polyangiaceae bacterium]